MRRGEGIMAGLVEEVASVLRERIYAGRIAPGGPLRQEPLAAELGVSRTPLREAIRLLEQDGLVRVDPRHGARVVTGDRATLLRAYELRAVVDGLAARLAARARPGAARVRELHVILAAQRAALDPWDARAYTVANVDFHEQLLHLSGNEFLVDRAPLLRMTAQVFGPVALLDPAGARRAVTEHAGIVDAVAAGDEDAAERLARAHVEATLDALRGGTG
ncbi:GntR family transcriptional regulator [Pseudonocardia sp. NPDC046786]|uniref:GntR family transcriptional regulator n=1 Tax=Pseudonocardia sp. NPDC046786 TaxID=3155471 RepID=UPI0034005F1E